MDDVVAIKINNGSEEVAAFLTWGRIFHPTDPTLLKETIGGHLVQFGLKGDLQISVCETIQEVSHYPYFYEGLLAIGREPIPFGPKYAEWQKKKRKKIEMGKELYFLGKIK